MIYGLVKKVRKGWRPGVRVSEDLSESEDEDHDEPGDLVFFINKKAPSRAELVKFHVLGLLDPTKSACKLVNAQDLEPAGHIPDDLLVCKRCKKARSDLFDLNGDASG